MLSATAATWQIITWSGSFTSESLEFTFNLLEFKSNQHTLFCFYRSRCKCFPRLLCRNGIPQIHNSFPDWLRVSNPLSVGPQWATTIKDHHHPKVHVMVVLRGRSTGWDIWGRISCDVTCQTLGDQSNPRGCVIMLYSFTTSLRK